MSCCSITRGIFRWGLIGGLALGGATLLLGPQRVAMGFAQLRAKAQNMVELTFDDPAAMRHQLEQLASEYPDRIAEVRGEIAEVDHQLSQFDRDIEIANRVVAMTSEDLNELRALVARAEGENTAGARRVSIRFEGNHYDVDEAYTEGRRIHAVRASYNDRVEHDKMQAEFLREQRARLSEILAKLESEFDTYQTQLWQLDRQIDSIERNERLIELTEQQQATLESYDRFGKIDNLRQVEAKLAELRTKQEAQLEYLEKRGVHSDYEERARYSIDDDQMDDPFAETIEIDLGDTATDEPTSDPIAWLDRN